jgi:hypothetical protein
LSLALIVGPRWQGGDDATCSGYGDGPRRHALANSGRAERIRAAPKGDRDLYGRLLEVRQGLSGSLHSAQFAKRREGVH